MLTYTQLRDIFYQLHLTEKADGWFFFAYPDSKAANAALSAIKELLKNTIYAEELTQANVVNDKYNHAEKPYRFRLTMSQYAEVNKFLQQDFGLDCKSFTAAIANPSSLAERVARAGKWSTVMAIIKTHPAGFSKPDADYGKVLLHAIASKQLPQVLSIIMSANPDLSVTDEKGYTAIEKAAMSGFWSAVTFIATRCTAFDESARFSKALFIAIMQNQWDVAEYLLALGIKPANHCVDGVKFSSLHLTVRKDNQRMTAALLDAQPLITEQQDSNGKTAFDHAIELGHAEMVNNIISVRVENGFKNNPKFFGVALFTAIAKKDLPTIKKLLEAGASLSLDRGNIKEEDLTKFVIKKEELSTYADEDLYDIDVPSKIGKSIKFEEITMRGSDIKRIVTAGASLKKADFTYYTAIVVAAQAGEWQIVKLIAKTIKTNSADRARYNHALILAIQANQTDVARTLLEAGASPNAVCPVSGFTALQCAAGKDNAEIVTGLLDKGADVNIKDLNKKMIFDYPLKTYSRNIWKTLILSHKVVVAKNAKNQTLLEQFAQAGDWEMVQEGINKHKADANDGTHYRQVLTEAMQANQFDVIQNLLNVNVGIYLSTFQATLLINYIIENNLFDLIERFVNDTLKGNKENSASIFGNGLLTAIEMGNHVITHRLLDAGANIKIKNINNQTAMQLAAETGLWPFVELIARKRQADKENAHQYGMILTKAIKMDVYERVIQALVEANPDLTVMDENGMTPIVVAASAKKWPIVHFIASKHQSNFDIDKACYGKALLLAMQADRNDIAKGLIKAGANVFVTEDEKAAMDLAVENHDWEMVEAIASQRKTNSHDSAHFIPAFKKAIENNQFGLAKLLIEQAMNVNDASLNGNEPLLNFIAIHLVNEPPLGSARGDELKDVFNRLLKKGANIQAVNASTHQSTFDIAINAGNYQLAHSILESALKLTPKNLTHDFMGQILLKAVDFRVNQFCFEIDLEASYKTLLEALFTAKATLNNEKDGLSAIEQAVIHHDWKTVELIASSVRADSTCTRNYGNALMMTIGMKNIEIAKLLVSANASLSVTDSTDITPVKLAAMNSEWNLVEHCLNKTKPDEADSQQYCAALLYAIKEDQTEIAINLLKAKTSPNKFSLSNMSCLHYAVLNANTTIVKNLLAANADLDYQDGSESKRTALDHAIVMGNLELVKLIVAKKRQAANHADYFGKALFGAIQYKAGYAIINELVTACANLDVSLNGKKLIDYAIEEKCIDLVAAIAGLNTSPMQKLAVRFIMELFHRDEVKMEINEILKVIQHPNMTAYIHKDILENLARLAKDKLLKLTIGTNTQVAESTQLGQFFKQQSSLSFYSIFNSTTPKEIFKLKAENKLNKAFDLIVNEEKETRGTLEKLLKKTP